MGFRWPWQTREDAVIRALDAALRDAAETRRDTAEKTEIIKADVQRRLEGKTE